MHLELRKINHRMTDVIMCVRRYGLYGIIESLGIFEREKLIEFLETKESGTL